MAFWKKNPNEYAYIGGKKHWTDIIKNSGESNLLLWRQPEEDFNTNSSLIVMPGETAIFVHAGSIEKVFDLPGTYKLTTENYPFISRLRNNFSGGISSFNCVVYFLRQAHSPEIRWGVSPAIQVRDPVHGIFCKIRTNGAYRISISDPSKFLMYLVGNNKYSFSEDDIKESFGSEIQMHIRSLITQFIKSSGAEILGICEYQVELSHLIKPYLMQALERYGIRLENFSIETMDIPEDDPNRLTLETAYAQHASLKVLGDDWARLESSKILQSLAQNPGAGGVASMGAGMGMGLSAAPVFANLAQQMFNHAPISQSPSHETVKPQPFGFGFEPQSTLPSQSVNSFEINRNESVSFAPSKDFEMSLQQLKFMRDNGYISQETYDAKIQEIMSRM